MHLLIRKATRQKTLGITKGEKRTVAVEKQILRAQRKENNHKKKET